MNLESEIESILMGFALSSASTYTDSKEVAEHFHNLGYRVMELRGFKWGAEEHSYKYYQIREASKYVSKEQMD